jgi:hypothetical protein
MAVRIKTKFRKKGPKSPEERASVVGAYIWRVAQETFRHMGKEDFNFGSEEQVTAVITEFVAFLVQVADRIVYGQLSEDDRLRFINALGQHLAKTMQANQLDFKGPGDHMSPFIRTLNARSADYAEFDYKERGPSYGFLRYLGERVAEAMSMSENKWVKEYVMEIEAPEMMKTVKRLVGEVMGVKVD